MLNCDSSAVLRIIVMAKKIMNMIQIIVPVILIVVCMFDIFKLVMSNMDKTSNTWKKIINRILAAVVVFLVPTLANMALSLVNVGNITASTCWVNATDEIVAALQVQEEKEAKDKANAEAKAAAEFDAQKRAEQLAARRAMNFAQSSNSSGGGILLIAGHSYQGTCEACDECRGYFNRYAEEVETRKLAVKLKEAILKEGMNAVIANQVLMGNENDEKMDTSFRCSRMGKGSQASTFTKLEQEGYWASFSHVIEIHFNASGNHTASGSLLTASSSEMSKITDIDNKILTAVSKYTGGKLDNWGFPGTLGDWDFFVNQKKKPMTYIEVEFYDNDAAMDRYSTKIDSMAKEVAQLLKSEGY